MPPKATPALSDDLLPQIEGIGNLGIYEMDLTTNTWTGSTHFIRISGLPVKPYYTAEEFQNMVHPDDLKAVMDHYAECLRSSDNFNMEYRLLHPDGQIVYISSRSKIFRDNNGTPVRILGIKQDVTKTRAGEIKLIQLNEMNEQKNEVLTMVAHDLKSPINQIKALISIMKHECSDPQHALLGIMENSCNNALDIVSDLIDTAQLEQNTRLNLVFTDINDMVKKACKHFEYYALQKDIVLKTSLAKNAHALVHRKKFQRVVDNLISNALKFSPKGSIVQVTTRRRNNKLFLSVIDKGTGIDEKHIPHLFNRFAKHRRRGTSGEASTGLGLSIVYEIIKKHKGEITVKSEVNKGTTFTVQIDAADQQTTVLSR